MDAILTENIPNEDLKRAEQRFYEEMRGNSGAGGQVSLDSQFQYASCLVRSRYAADVRKGVQMLKTMLDSGREQQQGRRDCLYFIAVGYAKVKEYPDALLNIRKLLSLEPSNRQAKDLEKVISKKMEHDAIVGAAVTGGAVLAVGGLVGLAAILLKRN